MTLVAPPRNLIAESTAWKIYDDGIINKVLKGEIVLEQLYSQTFLSYLKKLVPGHRYQFLRRWKDHWRFDQCFCEVGKNYPQYGNVITFYGFEGKSIKCKECSFETNLKVCPNCGEWN